MCGFGLRESYLGLNQLKVLLTNLFLHFFNLGSIINCSLGIKLGVIVHMSGRNFAMLRCC